MGEFFNRRSIGYLTFVCLVCTNTGKWEVLHFFCMLKRLIFWLSFNKEEEGERRVLQSARNYSRNSKRGGKWCEFITKNTLLSSSLTTHPRAEEAWLVLSVFLYSKHLCLILSFFFIDEIMSLF